jgi:hypothetical protein
MSAALGIVIQGFNFERLQDTTCNTVLRRCCDNLGITTSEAYLGNMGLTHYMLSHYLVFITQYRGTMLLEE